METLQIEIIEPRAKQLIDDLANLDLMKGYADREQGGIQEAARKDTVKRCGIAV